MNNDEEENNADMMRQKTDDAWDQSIATLSPKLRELDISERGPNPQEPPIEERCFKIRLASSNQRRKAANLLIQNKFSRRGYSTSDLNIKENSNRITLLIDLNDIIVGTITLGLDTPLGLEVDNTFKAEVDHLRANGRKLAEITNFAMEGSPNNTRLMASIAHLTYIYARRIHSCTDFVIEVNLRHSRYYEKMLGFKRCGPEKLSSWANAPTVLLCLDLDYMDKQIGKLGGSQPTRRGEKSLYPYFFSKQDEAGIAQRLSRG